MDNNFNKIEKSNNKLFDNSKGNSNFAVDKNNLCKENKNLYMLCKDLAKYFVFRKYILSPLAFMFFNSEYYSTTEYDLKVVVEEKRY